MVCGIFAKATEAQLQQISEFPQRQVGAVLPLLVALIALVQTLAKSTSRIPPVLKNGAWITPPWTIEAAGGQERNNAKAVKAIYRDSLIAPAHPPTGGRKKNPAFSPDYDQILQRFSLTVPNSPMMVEICPSNRATQSNKSCGVRGQRRKTAASLSAKSIASSGGRHCGGSRSLVDLHGSRHGIASPRRPPPGAQ